MASSWLLVLAVLGGACALPAPETFSYSQALVQAVDSFNQRPEVQNAFRLLSAEPEPAPGLELSSLHGFNFSMMETTCASSSRSDPEDCDFKENGVIFQCLGLVKNTPDSPKLDLSCSDASSDPVPVQRGRSGRKFRRFRPKITFEVHLKLKLRLG